ncbi:hypothetical protein K1T71_002152 [Dendrolimus kikuchii]|uniref:Uncharacterized protein n=1 Tax=Dendrolimus kikuchii TaxID=765133 RepID=A0ACC1DFQ8_9NEOP|nr:hypothetical protein K1T71_002152 [Dendrolimus kikuchii]
MRAYIDPMAGNAQGLKQLAFFKQVHEVTDKVFGQYPLAEVVILEKFNAHHAESWSKVVQASQTVAKPGLTRNKVMLCVWWDWKGIIYYELLPPGRTIDSELYCEQLMRLKQKVERKRPELINRRGVVFHHDKASVIDLTHL